MSGAYDESLVYAATEVPFTITFHSLLEWAGVGWSTFSSSQARSLDTIIRGQIDFLSYHSHYTEPGGTEHDGPTLVVRDYKTFVPNDPEDYRLPLLFF